MSSDNHKIKEKIDLRWLTDIELKPAPLSTWSLALGALAMIALITAIFAIFKGIDLWLLMS